MKTVHDKVAEDVAGPNFFFQESAPAPCVVCGFVRYLRYGCCLACARVTAWDDPRVTRDVRVGGKGASSG